MEPSVKGLSSVRAQAQELFSIIGEEQANTLKLWNSEKEDKERVLKSLSQSEEILKKEKKRVGSELQASRAKASGSSGNVAAAGARQAQSAQQGLSAADKDLVVDLQTKLIDLNNKLLDIDMDLKVVNSELASCAKADMRDLLSSKLVVLQDTKRILQDEIDTLRATIFRIEGAARVEADRRCAEESGYAELSRIDEQLARITARIDREKQNLYFPSCKGYRFSAGASGVYLAAADLFISEVSGRFELACEKVTKPDGSHVARLSVSVGGVSASKDMAEARSGQGLSRTTTSGGGAGLGLGAGLTTGMTPSSSMASLGSDAAARRSTQQGTAGGGSAAALATSSSVRSTDLGTVGSVGSADGTGTGASAGPPSPPLPPAPPPAAPPPVPAPGALPPPGPGKQSIWGEGGAVSRRVSADRDSGGGGGSSSGGVAGAGQGLAPEATHPLASAGSTDHTTPGHSGPLAGSHGSVSPRVVSPAGSPGYGAAPAQAGGFPMPQGSGVAGQVPGAQRPPLPAASGPAGSRQKPKGEMASNFLSTLHRTKAQLKKAVGGPESAAPGAGGPGQGPAGLLGAEGSASMSQRLHGKMDKLKDMGHALGDKLGDKLDRMKEGMEDKMDKVKGGLGEVKGTLGEKVDKVKEGLGEVKGTLGGKVDRVKEGMQESKGKLSMFARALANKAPAVGKRKSSGGGGSGNDSRRSSLNEQRLEGLPAVEGASAVAASRAGAAGTGVQQARGEQVEGSGVLSAQGGLTFNDDYFDQQGQGLGGAGAAGGAGQQELEQQGSGSVAGGAAAATERSSSEQQQQQQGVAGGMRRSNTKGGAAGSEGGMDASAAFGAEASVAFEEFEEQPARKGVYVQLLGEKVEVVGERGTKVPDMSVKELLLEVEVVMNAVLEWSPVHGWQVPETRPLEFNILQLEHKMRGNTIPLPKTALKALLNLLLPSALTKLALSSLAPELGQYVMASGESVQLSGEVRVTGQALSTYVGDMSPNKQPLDPARRAKWLQQEQAAARARGLLGVTDLQAMALAELFTGKHALLSPARPLSICELCRFHTTYSTSQLWRPLCGLYNKALQLCFEHYSVPPADRFTFTRFMEGPVARLVRKPVRIALTLDTLRFALDVDVALHTLRDWLERLAREYHRAREAGDPRTASAAPPEPLPQQLEALDAWHAGLVTALRAFKARFKAASCSVLASADSQVFQFGAEGVSYEGPLRLRLPLELAVDAGEQSFSIDVRLPDRQAALSSVTSMVQDILYNLSGTVAAQGDGDGASEGGRGGSKASSQQSSPGPGAKPGPGGGAEKEAGDTGPKELSAKEAYLRKWHALMQAKGLASFTGKGGLAGAAAAAAAAAVAAGAGGLGGGLSGSSEEDEEGGEDDSLLPLLEDPVIGQLACRKLSLGLKLDEERLAELLTAAAASLPPTLFTGAAAGTAGSGDAPAPAGAQGAPGLAGTIRGLAGGKPGADSSPLGTLLGTLMSCYGDLFSTSLDLGWRPDPSPDAESGATRPACMLTVSNNEVTRVAASLESLMFQSSVSPRLAVRVLAAVAVRTLSRFYARDSYQVRFWEKLFSHVEEYAGKAALDALLCVSARAELIKPHTLLEQAAASAASAAARGAPVGSVQLHPHHAGGKLRVVVTGDRGANPGGLAHVAPIYLVNDINLLTLLDSVKLLTEST